jgi:hypothetical protein
VEKENKMATTINLSNLRASLDQLLKENEEIDKSIETAQAEYAAKKQKLLEIVEKKYKIILDRGNITRQITLYKGKKF